MKKERFGGGFIYERGSTVWTVEDNNFIKEKENKEIGIFGFAYTLFEEKKDGGVRESIHRDSYLNHIIEFLPRYLGSSWVL